jgi:hypothetical protein
VLLAPSPLSLAVVSHPALTISSDLVHGGNPRDWVVVEQTIVYSRVSTL